MTTPTKPRHNPAPYIAHAQRDATCTVCHKALSSGDPLRLEGVCSTTCLAADAPRRARYQNPNWKP